MRAGKGKARGGPWRGKRGCIGGFSPCEARRSNTKAGWWVREAGTMIDGSRGAIGLPGSWRRTADDGVTAGRRRAG